MTAVVAPALGLAGCFLLGLYGLVLYRDQPVERLSLGRARQDERERARRSSLVGRLFGWLSRRLGPPLLEALPEWSLRRTRRRLELAGRPGGETLRAHVGRKAAFAALFGAAALVMLATGNLFLAAILAVLGWIWADMWLGSEGRRRQHRIERELPDFLDVLAVTVGAGVAFQPALSRVGAALGGPLSEEFETALRQMAIGSGRREAFRALRDRSSSKGLAEFITALLQAEQLGVPITDAMAGLARDMRRSFHQDARRRAARAAPRISLIVSMLIVPAAVLIIVTALIVGSELNMGDLLG